MNKRVVRLVATLAVTGLATAYLIWKISLRETIEILGDAHWGYFLASILVKLLPVVPMAWRWQLLLAA